MYVHLHNYTVICTHTAKHTHSYFSIYGLQMQLPSGRHADKRLFGNLITQQLKLLQMTSEVI